MAHTILIIEDEIELAEILGAYLNVEGFKAVVANDGEMGLRLFEQEKPSLILLDIMLPKVDGITICREVREKSEIPIIMISAKSGEMDKVVALGIGADDYVTKPFSPLELVARVKAQLRRYEKSISNIEGQDKNLLMGDLVLKPSSYEVLIRGEKVEFTTKEFELLYFLAKRPGQVFSKTQIYEGVWGYENVSDDNSVTVYINRIREKLAKSNHQYIKTVWGAGYKFSIEEA